MYTNAKPMHWSGDMKNPLNKRLWRQVKEDLGKYLALFLFLVLLISLGSGFLVADNSMIVTYNQSFQKYNIEDRHFSTAQILDGSMRLALEKRSDTHIYPLFYKDVSFGKKQTMRVFMPRKKVDKTDMLEGRMSQKKHEVAIDRVYAYNNDIQIGSAIKLDGIRYKVTGFVALSDYSCMFKNNSDMMFDAQNFSTAIMTKEGFDSLDTPVTNTYAWTNGRHTSYKNNGRQIMEILAANGILTDFLREQDNQAIHFTGDDMGGDRMMMVVLLYVIIVIIGFIFAVSAKSTIEKESLVIGTLRATGYRKKELLKHYMILPLTFTIAAALLGNILGYTIMKEYMMKAYYNSYSLFPYKTIWNMDAFWLTTLIPILLIFLIHLYVLSSTLSLTPFDLCGMICTNIVPRKRFVYPIGSF